MEVILADDQHRGWLQQHDALLRDELNVKTVEYTHDAEQYITYQVQPNFKRLGPRVGRRMPQVKQALNQAEGAGLLADLRTSGRIVLDVDGESIELDSEDIQVRLQAKPGWAADDQSEHCVVVLNTELTPELIREGLARDLVRLIQEQRKAMDCQYTDRIRVGVQTESEDLRAAIEENAESIRQETLAVELSLGALVSVQAEEITIAGNTAKLFIVVIAD